MTGVANKLATLLHQLHIIIPKGIAFNDFMGPFASLTPDVGHEMSMPLFSREEVGGLVTTMDQSRATHI